MSKTTVASARYLDAMTEIAKYLDPQNENVRRGDLVLAIRDLAQIAISEKDNAEKLEAVLAEIAGMNGGIAEEDAASTAATAIGWIYNHETRRNEPPKETP